MWCNKKCVFIYDIRRYRIVMYPTSWSPNSGGKVITIGRAQKRLHALLPHPTSCLTVDAALESCSNWFPDSTQTISSSSCCYLNRILPARNFFKSKLLRVRNFILRLQSLSLLYRIWHQNPNFNNRSVHNGRSRRCIRRSVSYPLNTLYISICTRLTQTLGSDFEEETSMQKFKRRLKEEPLIPLGTSIPFPSLTNSIPKYLD